MQTVPLGGKAAAGRVALIDDGDAPLIAGYSWYADKHRQTWYAASHIPGSGHHGRKIYMHTLISGNAQTDHANGNGLDNRRANLRPATSSQNQANRHRGNGGASRFRGVCPSGYGGWRATITVRGRQRHLGTFTTEEDAARAYDAAAAAGWGEYARLNYPCGGPAESRP